MADLQIHAWIIAPDAKCRAELKKGLRAHAGVRPVREFAGWAEAAPLLREKAPDVIFADPLVGKTRTLDWIDEVPRPVAVVLLAAHPRLAVRAFEKRVADYLVRPVAPPRLNLTIERLAEWKALRARPGRGSRGEKKILIHSRHESTVIRPQAIVCIRAEGNYTSLTLHGGERKLVHRSLRQWGRLLPGGDFFQIHRSTLINLDQVKYLERKEAGRSLLHLRDHAEPLPVSRRLALKLRHRLKAFRRA